MLPPGEPSSPNRTACGWKFTIKQCSGFCFLPSVRNDHPRSHTPPSVVALLDSVSGLPLHSLRLVISTNRFPLQRRTTPVVTGNRRECPRMVAGSVQKPWWGTCIQDSRYVDSYAVLLSNPTCNNADGRRLYRLRILVLVVERKQQKVGDSGGTSIFALYSGCCRSETSRLTSLRIGDES